MRIFESREEALAYLNDAIEAMEYAVMASPNVEREMMVEHLSCVVSRDTSFIWDDIGITPNEDGVLEASVWWFGVVSVPLPEHVASLIAHHGIHSGFIDIDICLPEELSSVLSISNEWNASLVELMARVRTWVEEMMEYTDPDRKLTGEERDRLSRLAWKVIYAPDLKGLLDKYDIPNNWIQIAINHGGLYDRYALFMNEGLHKAWGPCVKFGSTRGFVSRIPKAVNAILLKEWKGLVALTNE